MTMDEFNLPIDAELALDLEICVPDANIPMTVDELAQLFPILFRPLTEKELEEDGGSEKS